MLETRRLQASAAPGARRPAWLWQLRPGISAQNWKFLWHFCSRARKSVLVLARLGQHFRAMRAEKRRRRCEARLATQRRATFLGHRPAHSALGQRRDSPVPPVRGLLPPQSTRSLFPAQMVRSGLLSWYKRTEIYKNPGKRGRNSDFHPEILCFHFCTVDDRSAEVGKSDLTLGNEPLRFRNVSEDLKQASSRPLGGFFDAKTSSETLRNRNGSFPSVKSDFPTCTGFLSRDGTKF